MELIWNHADLRQIDKYGAPAYEIKHDPGDPWEGQVLGIERFKERVQYSRNAWRSQFLRSVLV